MRLQYFYFAFLFLLLLPLIGNAQLNVAVGYGANFTNVNITDAIINRYNNTRQGLEEEFPNLNYMHGLSFGARYRWDFVGLELLWTGRFRDTGASGTIPDTTITFSRDLNYRYNSYSLGLDNHFGRFSFGGTIALDEFRVKTETQSIEKAYSVIKDTGFSSQFYVMYTMPGAGPLSVGIRPFVKIPWTSYNVAELEREILPENSSNIDVEAYNEKPLTFGLMFIFYNGQSVD